MHPAFTYREIDHESGCFKPKQDCNYTFPIDLAPKGILLGAKSIGNLYLLSKFGVILPRFQNLVNIYIWLIYTYIYLLIYLIRFSSYFFIIIICVQVRKPEQSHVYIMVYQIRSSSGLFLSICR